VPVNDTYDTEAVARSEGMLRRESGRLLIEDVPVDELVDQFSAPLFVISEATLRGRARRIQAAFRRAWPGGDVLVLPSVKANPALALHRVLAQEGHGSDLVGAGELEMALRAGIDPGRISLNGTAKDAATIERAVAAGVRITIDDVREIELARRAASAVGRQANLRLRLRPYVPTQAMMDAFDVPIREIYGKYKSGIPYDDLPEAARAVSVPEVDLSGVMMHMGRYTTDLSVIGEFSRNFGELAAEVSDLLGGWSPRTIDIGGGFAPPVDGFGRGRPDYVAPDPPSIERYAEVICSGVRAGLAAGGARIEVCTLEVEPGRSLFAPCGIHVATVRNVKRQQRPFPFTWYETDTTQEFLAEIATSAGRPPVIPVRATDPASLTEARVVGISCRSDVLAQTATLPTMAPGDLLAFCFTGAYNDAAATNFNILPRPATVLVTGSAAHLIRRAETIDEILARETVPDHLLAKTGGSRA
jgi:diaminopimelate decarboxylase